MPKAAQQEVICGMSFGKSAKGSVASILGKAVVLMMKLGTKAAFLRTVRQAYHSGPGRRAAVLTGWFCAGFSLAAASVARSFQPLALGLLCASRGG